jgi:hypothetical protein
VRLCLPYVPALAAPNLEDVVRETIGKLSDWRRHAQKSANADAAGPSSTELRPALDEIAMRNNCALPPHMQIAALVRRTQDGLHEKSLRALDLRHIFAQASHPAECGKRGYDGLRLRNWTTQMLASTRARL